MKLITLSASLIISLSATIFAATVTDNQVSNDYFVVDFKNLGSWNAESLNNIDSIRASVEKSIDHWGDLLGTAHLPKLENRVTVSLEFTAASNAGGSLPLFHKINPATDDFFTLPDGTQYTTVSNAEAKLKFGKSLVESDEKDISITFNSGLSFYYGESAPTGYGNRDFHTFFLHELTHGMGVASQTFTSGFTPNYLSEGVMEKTAWDAIMGIDAEDLLPDGSFDYTSTTYIGDDGISVFYKTTWVQGTNMSHLSAGYLDTELDNRLVMVPQVIGARREFSEEEIAIFNLMGWRLGEDVLPEPSTATLSIFALSALLLRRRRRRAL